MIPHDTEPDTLELGIARLRHAVDAGRLTLVDALRHAAALGVELDRLSRMRRACEDYDEARTARAQAFAAERSSSRPPGRDR